MKGRNEHTDDIQHNGGTFHYQVSERETWTMDNSSHRGASKLCDELDVALKGSYVHTVEEAGVFANNTRLRWHQTEIPGTCIDTARTLRNATNLSISYARHCIYLDETRPPAGDEEYEYERWSMGYCVYHKRNHSIY
jgi:hypothetical protein